MPVTSAAPRTDFYWVEDREPHFGRRKAILEKHPEVTKLFGVNPRLKYITVALVIIQLLTALYLPGVLDYTYGWLVLIAVAYFIGATIAHALFLAIHEITHYLAFKKKSYNNILAFIANLPIILPYAMSFKYYHALHHWEQGKDGADADIPLAGEARLFNGLLGKSVWFIHQILFYAARPMFVTKMSLDRWTVANIIFQVAAMIVFTYYAGWYGLLYLLLSLFFAGGLHPSSGHFISEHYVFHEGQETYSYYGPWNLLLFNVGYHNEHHDFPTIPGSRLPELKKMAPEFYDNLHSYNSWTSLIFQFLTKKDINLFSRTKRH